MNTNLRKIPFDLSQSYVLIQLNITGLIILENYSVLLEANFSWSIFDLHLKQEIDGSRTPCPANNGLICLIARLDFPMPYCSASFLVFGFLERLR